MNFIFKIGFHKTAGGPGSGVSGNNTDAIDFMEHSPLISIGKRKDFLDNTKPLETKDIEVSRIRFKGQHKYVPEKLMSMIMNDVRGDTGLWTKPIKVLKDSNDEYHVVDGHHRFLAALIRGREKIKAEIYPSNKLEKTAKEKRHYEINRRALGLEPVSTVPLDDREELIPLSQGNPHDQNPSLF